MDIAGKTAIATGGASGLDLATLERYAADGANVAISDLNEEAGTATAKRLGDKVIYFNVLRLATEKMDAAIRMQPK